MTKDKPAKPDEDRRTYGMVSIAVPSDRVTRPVFGKHGFAGGALVVDWPAIVGSAVASHTLPQRIRFPPKERAEGTLVVKVDSGAFAVEMQHLEPLILERINGYFGWKAVARLKLQQGPLPQPTAQAKARTATPAKPGGGGLSQSLAARLAEVEDPELRDALARLGAMLSKS